MINKKCKIEDCNNEVFCKEMCHKCYDKQYDLDHKEERKQYKSDNKEKIKEQKKQYNLEHKDEAKQYYSDNKEKINEQHKQYQSNHKEEIKEQKKHYQSDNKEKLKEQKKQDDLDHKEEKKEYDKQYNSSNKEKINKRLKQRRQTDPMFKIMQNASNAVNKMLKRNGGSNQGKSSKKQFRFTKDQLEAHLDALFSHPDNLDENGEVWMTLDNHGNYDPNKRTWHLDHITPKSSFNCINMEEDNFQKC